MQEKSISLIEYCPDRGYEMPAAAQNFLMSLPQQPFAVLGMVGKARTGKSYILNQILNENVFAVQGRVGGCTKGIKISPVLRDNPIQGCKFIVIDSEGMGGSESTDQRDSRVFLLNMLLCSTLMYNSLGVIDQQALNGLSLVVGLGKLLHQEIEDQQSKDQQGNFPNFFWLIRDFMLKMETEHGVPMTPKEYLERALEEQKGLSTATTQKNRIRRLIKGFFMERDCEALIRPVDQQELLFSLEQTPKSKLRQQFVTVVDKIRTKIFKRLKPKKMKGFPVTGRALVSQIKLYLESFNHNGMPRVQSIWNTVCIKQSKIVQRTIEENLDKVIQSFDNINNLNQSYELLEERISRISKDEIRWVGGEDYIKQIKEKFNKKLEHKKVQLAEKEKIRCNQFIQHSQVEMAKKNTLNQLAQYYENIAKQAKEDYKGLIQTPGTILSLNQILLKIENSYLKNRLSKSMKNDGEKSKAEIQLALIKKQIKFLSQKNANLQRQRSTLIRTIESQQKCIDQLRQAKNSRHQVASFGVLSSNKKQLSEQYSISAIEDPHLNGISVVEKVLEMYKKLQEKHTKLTEMINSAQAFICAACSGRFDIIQFQKHHSKCKQQSPFKDHSPLKDVSQSMITLNKQKPQNLIQISNPSFFTPYLTLPEGALTVQISKTLIKQDSQQRNYVQYTLQVKLYKSNWSLNRKYRDFCELHDLLLIMFPKMQFPQSSQIMKCNLLASAIGGSSSSRKLVVEERRKMLEEYLRDLLAIKQIRNTRIMQKFLKLNKEYEQLEYLEKDEKSMAKSSVDAVAKRQPHRTHAQRDSREIRELRKMKLSFNR